MADENTNVTPNTDNASEPTGDVSVEQKRELVIEALRSVIDPEIGLNIVQLGLIREVQIEDEKQHIVMILTTPFCPYGPQLLEAARQKGQDALGIPTTIEVGMDVWDPSMAEDGILDDWGLY